MSQTPVNTRLLLADDTLIAREGWRRILETEHDIEIAGEAITAEEVLSMARSSLPDVVLMDLSWYGDRAAGLDTIRSLKSALPSLRIVATTAYDDLINDARSAGADATLPKGFSKAELLSVVRNVPLAARVKGPRKQVALSAKPIEPSVNTRSLITMLAVLISGVLILMIVFVVSAKQLPLFAFIIVTLAVTAIFFWIIIFVARASGLITEKSAAQSFLAIITMFKVNFAGLVRIAGKGAGDGTKD